MTDADETTYLLPPAAYASQAWFDAEKEQLFERTWVFAGVEHDLARPGDVVTVQVGRSPVIVVRGNDGVLRAFHNTCRHRGLPLVDGDGSCGKALVCPYHRWNYGLDGALRAVPQREQFPDLDFDDLGLIPVRVDAWKTLVFVTLDAEIEGLHAWMGGMESMLPNFHPEELVEVCTMRHDIASNWKLYLENHVDWLHLWYLHSETLGHYDHSKGERAEWGRHWTSFEWTHEPQDQDERWDPGDDGGGLLPIPGLSHHEATNGAHMVFPSLTLFTNSDYWMIGQLLPLTPGTSQLVLRVFAMPGSDADQFAPVLEVVMREDYSATEAIQRALGSPAFAVGPLATSYEREISRFHRHYLEYVEPPS